VISFFTIMSSQSLSGPDAARASFFAMPNPFVENREAAGTRPGRKAPGVQAAIRKMALV
jgi:hypothetical protein